MPDSWQILGWIIIGFIVLAGLIFLGMVLKVYIEQWLADRKRKRAHAGKVRCEEREEPCREKATRRTPHGYFCEEHQAKNSRRRGAFASVSYAHMLEHYRKGSR